MDFAPMLASLAEPPLADPELVYEPKYDGIRAIAEVPVNGRVRLWSRLGNEKTSQFPEIAGALERWARGLKEPVVLDGEVVALDSKGDPTGFQQLQGRIHLTDNPSDFQRRGRKGRSGSDRPSASAASSAEQPAAYIAFDLLKEGAEDLRELPLTERRRRLERLFGDTGSTLLRLSEQVRGDAHALYARALERGWEGLIAKHASSRYRSGKRTPDWRKLKILHEQEFVVGGWTEPRETRAYFGALMLGVYEGDALVYTGHIGTGFNEQELARVMKLLKPLETKECPFRERPPTNEKPHWVQPKLVAQVKFTEWTADGKLRHPVYLGLRDDKDPTDVRREEQTRFHATTKARLKPNPTRAEGESLRSSPRHREAGPARGNESLIDQLQALEDARRDGTIDLPDGDKLAVTNLHKVFWPAQKITKGNLLRYYARIGAVILPAVADRPLVMKRYPNGIPGKPFYQHRAPDQVPPGVRVEMVKAAEGRPQIVGGNLKTLLYMTQLAAISQDPWFSRVQHPQFADHTAIDLDPMPGVSFAVVLDVARWIRDELQSLNVTGVPKTSGADGLHIYIPLPPQTPYEAGLLFCQIIATLVANKHPKQATVERAVGARGKRVYVDCLQNILGKTLATAYSARASDYAGVSTPLRWKEVDEGVRREDFTIQSVPARVEKVGDLWAALRHAKPADLSRVARYAKRGAKD